MSASPAPRGCEALDALDALDPLDPRTRLNPRNGLDPRHPLNSLNPRHPLTRASLIFINMPNSFFCDASSMPMPVSLTSTDK